jgi:hypothetical protein
MGSLIKRCVYFLDDKLIMPNRLGKFKKQIVGITFANNINNCTANYNRN